jgi:hypothetical protein
MPTVPTYGGPQIGVNALRPPAQQAIDVSSGLQSLARGVEQAGQVLDARIVRDAEAEANRVDEEITTGWLRWNSENRRNYQGEKAGDYEKAAQDWWDKTATTYGKDLSPLASRQVGQALTRKRGRALADVAEYVNAEGERFADSKAESAALAAIEFGVDTGDYAGARERVLQVNAQKAARKGWNTDMLAAENQRLVGALHLTAIEKLAETNAATASAYYERVKGEVPAAAQNKIERVLKGEADNQFATQFAAENATKTVAEQMELAAKITDPERKQKTLQAVQNAQTLKRAAQQEQEAAASDEAWQLASQGRSVPESVLIRMNGRERATLKDWQREKAKQAASGENVKTDWATYIDTRERLAAGENVDLRPLTTKVAPAQMEQLLDIKTRTRDPKKAPEVATAEQQVSSYVNTLKLTGQNDAEKRGKFQGAAQDLFNEHLKRTGKEPTFEERQKILDQLSVEVVTKPGWLWDTTGPAYELPREDLRRRVAPAAPARVATQEEWARLPKGTRYVAPDGTTRTKQ